MNEIFSAPSLFVTVMGQHKQALAQIFQSIAQVRRLTCKSLHDILLLILHASEWPQAKRETASSLSRVVQTRKSDSLLHIIGK